MFFPLGSQVREEYWKWACLLTGSKYTEFNSSTTGTGTSQTRVRGWPAGGLGGRACASSASPVSFLRRLSGPQNQGCEGSSVQDGSTYSRPLSLCLLFRHPPAFGPASDEGM